jgi:hypothetical protein
VLLINSRATPTPTTSAAWYGTARSRYRANIKNIISGQGRSHDGQNPRCRHQATGHLQR